MGVLAGEEDDAELSRIFSILRRAKLTMWAAEGSESDFAIRLWTPGAETIYGYSKKEALGSSYIDLIVNPDERDRAIEDHARMVANDEEYEWDWSADDVAKDGTTRTVLTNCFPIWDAELQKHLLAEIAIDISRKEQAARKLRQLQAESIDRSHQAANMRGIAAVESMYAEVAERSGGGSPGAPVTAPAACAAVRTIVDGTPAVRMWLHGPDGPELADGSDQVAKPAINELEAFNHLASSSSPMAIFVDSSDRTASFAISRPRGKARAAAVIPIVFPFEMRGMLAVHFSDFRRITDSERSSLSQLGLHLGVALKMEELSRELQRRRDLDLLHIKSRALETALRAVFHKVSGPVHAIKGGLERIETLVRSSAPSSEILDLIGQVQAGNLDVATELTRFREEREHGDNVQLLELADLCRAKAQDLAHRFPTVRVKVSIPDALRVAATGFLATFLVSEAIEILLTNAAEAMVATDGGGDIRLSAHHVGLNQVRLLVEDSGPGVPAELRTRIWFRGMSTKEDSDGRQRGDGLPAARDGIELAGGFLELLDQQSALGGASFSITFSSPTLEPVLGGEVKA